MGSGQTPTEREGETTVPGLVNGSPGPVHPHSSEEEREEEDNYPPLWNLALLSIALSLCVFCVALVRCIC